MLYYALKTWKYQNIILLLASYIFYAAWNPPFVVLLWLSTVVDWFVSKRIYAAKNKAQRKGWLWLSLLTNLGLLSFFKYGNFIIDNFNFIFPQGYSVEHYSIILPVGISFYTFQTLSYTLDIYRDQSKPWHSFLDYALYVTFFPQLVAGPIVRSDEFLQQCVSQKKWNWDAIGYGFYWLIVGLFLKVVVADHFLSPVANAVYVSNGKTDMLSSWMGTVAFSGQILCDFAGYSICAIGVARMLGFELPKNFKFPYASTGFSEFWRRWHISLSTWLRDYLYIPLGGNRKGDFRTYQNLMTTMLIGGLWHGASWTFVVWGGMHGIYLTLERLLRRQFDFERIPHIFRVLGVFVLVCFTWVFFRAQNFEQAGNIILSMLHLHTGNPILETNDTALVALIMLLLMASNYIFRNIDLEEKVKRLRWWQLSVSLSFLLYFIFTLTGEDSSFIYFQF